MSQSFDTTVSLPLPNNIRAPEGIQTRDNRKPQPDYHLHVCILITSGRSDNTLERSRSKNEEIPQIFGQLLSKTEEILCNRQQ
jgi:hypothetical protein